MTRIILSSPVWPVSIAFLIIFLTLKIIGREAASVHIVNARNSLKYKI